MQRFPRGIYASINQIIISVILIALMVILALLSGCAGTTTASALTAAQKLQQDVTMACNVLQPAIQPYAPILGTNSKFQAFNNDLTLVCSGVATAHVADINSIINSSAAAAQAVVPMIETNQNDALLIEGLIGAFAGSLKNAIAAYQAQQPVSAPVAASS